MLRECLLASLLVLAFADHHEADLNDDLNDDQFSGCSDKHKREVKDIWQSVFTSLSTERKLTFARAVFDESVILRSLVVIIIIIIIINFFDLLTTDRDEVCSRNV